MRACPEACSLALFLARRARTAHDRWGAEVVTAHRVDERQNEEGVRLRGEGEGAEDVEPVRGGRDDDAGRLRVPVHLLDVLLALVAEEELRRDVLEPVGVVARRALVLVLLDRKVPQRDLVVGAGRSEARLVGRVPLDRGDRAGVPVEGGDGRRCGCLGAADGQRERRARVSLGLLRSPSRRLVVDVGSGKRKSEQRRRTP